MVLVVPKIVVGLASSRVMEVLVVLRAVVKKD